MKKYKEQLSKADIKRACDILRRDDGVGPGNYVEQLSWLLFLRVFERVEKELKELTEAEGKRYKDIIEKEYRWSSWAKKDWKDKDELIHFINKKLFPYLRSLKGTREKEKVADVFRELDGNKIRSPYTLLDVVDILDEIDMSHFQDTHLLSHVYEEILQEMGSENGWSGEFYTPRPIIRLMIKIINPKLGETIMDPFVGSGGFLVETFDYISQNIKMGVKKWDILQNKTFSGQEKKPLPYLIGTMNMMLHGILVPNLIRTNTLMEDVHNVSETSKVDVILTNPPFGGQEHKTVQNNFPIKVAATEALALQYVMRKLKNGGRCGIVLPEGQILFGTGAFQKIREELLQKFNIHTIISLPRGVFTTVGAGVKTNLIFFEKSGSTKEIWYGKVAGNFTKVQSIKDVHLDDIFVRWQKKEISSNTWIVSIDQIKQNNYSLVPINPNKQEEKRKTKSKKEILNDISNSISKAKKIINKLNNMLNE